MIRQTSALYRIRNFVQFFNTILALESLARVNLLLTVFKVFRQSFAFCAGFALFPENRLQLSKTEILSERSLKQRPRRQRHVHPRVLPLLQPPRRLPHLRESSPRRRRERYQQTTRRTTRLSSFFGFPVVARNRQEIDNDKIRRTDGFGSRA